MIEKLLVVSILVFGFAGAGAGEDETYRWEDADGNVYYSDLPPPAGALNVRRTRVKSEAPTASLPYELQVAVSKFPVTIYVTTDCGDPCDIASEFLIERGIPHTLLDAMRPGVSEKLNALTRGQLGVPTAEVGSIVLRGFEEGRWNAALDTAGYPREAMISVTPKVPGANDIDSDDFESDEFDDVDDEIELEDEE